MGALGCCGIGHVMTMQERATRHRWDMGTLGQPRANIALHVGPAPTLSTRATYTPEPSTGGGMTQNEWLIAIALAAVTVGIAVAASSGRRRRRR